MKIRITEAKALLAKVHSFCIELEAPPIEATDTLLTWSTGEARACVDGAVWCHTFNNAFDVRLYDRMSAGQLARFVATLRK